MKNAKLISILIGVLLGCITTSIIIPILIHNRVNQVEQLVGSPYQSNDTSASAVMYNTLQSADMQLMSGNPQAAIDIILPVVETWDSRIDQATAYQLLATAELRLANYDSAIGYAKKMVELNPGSYAYQLLAVAYEADGQFDLAMQAYSMVLSYDDADPRTDFEYASQRIIEIQEELGIEAP